MGFAGGYPAGPGAVNMRIPPLAPGRWSWLAADVAGSTRTGNCCTCSPTARTASAWPRAPARPRAGPRWRRPGSMNRRHRRDRQAGRAGC